MKRLILTFVAVFSPLFPDGASPQEILDIQRQSACAECRISVEHVASLGGIDQPVAFWALTSVAVDAQGKFFVGTLVGDRGRLATFHPDGGFIGMLGRSGDGPGEFRNIAHVVMDGGDSLHVFEMQRRTVLSPGERTLVRTSPMMGRAPQRMLLLPEGRALLNLHGRTVGMPDRIGMPFHVIDESGRYVRSFGPETQVRPGSATSDLLGGWQFADAGDGRFWAMPRHFRYEIQLWDTAGVHLRTITRDAEWIDATPNPGRTGQKRPISDVQGLRLDDQGRLWIAAWVAEEGWQPRAEGEPSIPLDNLDTVIEVVDPVAGKLLATLRHKGPAARFAGSDLIFGLYPDEYGDYTIEVWRLQFHTPQGRYQQ